MKKIVVIAVFAALLLSACGKSQGGKGARSSGEVKVGPLPDKIYMNVKMKEEIGLKDASEGLTDVFYYWVNGPTMMGLDQETRDKLDIYSAPSGWWDLFINPIPNAAPYIVTVSGKDYFNPFGIREVRYALNFLINRQYIVDEILAGAGGAMLTVCPEVLPGSHKYNLVAGKMGLKKEGDEKKGIEDITRALQAAAELPALKNRLKMGEQWWMFDDEPVSVKFLIRVDDPQGRLKEGEYISQQIEKAKIKVERLLYDRSKCSKLYRGSNPADYQWNLYTGGWRSGAASGFFETRISQMYAPWYGQMPGQQKPEFWNYANAEIDELTQRAYSGDYYDEDEYWDLLLKATEIGLHEAVRITMIYRNAFYVANKSRLNKRMVYGLGDGYNRWSLISADTDDRSLKVTFFSSKGALFMAAWDPVGTDGFSDTYSTSCAYPVTDVDMFLNPSTGIYTPLRAVPKDVVTEVEKNSAGELIGKIDISPEAIVYDSQNEVWVQVGAGTKSMSKGTYTYLYSNYHHGRPMSIADLLYARAFRDEWRNEDGENDPYYDASYDKKMSPGSNTIKGWLLNKDGTITVFFNYNFPPSKEKVANWGAPSHIVSARDAGVSWEIIEALAKIVAEGSASGTKYSFTKGEATDVDILRPTCVQDIRAKLVELRDAKHVPPSIREYISVEDALASYTAAIDWIDKYGHAYISNGPYYLEKYEPTSNYMELTAFRDSTYPFKSDYWPNFFASTTAQIDSLDIPSTFGRDSQEKGLAVKVYVSEETYPDNVSTPTDKALVTATLVTDEGEFSFDCKGVKKGYYETLIPIEKMKGLEPGDYTILVNAKMKGMEGAIPTTLAGTTTVF